MATRSKVATSVYLEAEQATRLRESSERSGVPVAVLIRRGVDRVLDDEARAIDPLQLLTPEFIEQLAPAELVALASRLGLPVPGMGAL